MNRKHSVEIKQAVLKRVDNGESIAVIISDTLIPRSTVYAWIKQSAEDEIKKRIISLRNFRLLENKVVRLEGIIEILKSVDCNVNDPLKIKLSALEKLQSQYNVHMMCEALNVPRGI